MAPVTSGLHLPGRRDRRYLERRSPRLVNLACAARARPDQLYFHTVVLPVPAVASMLPVRLNATALPPPARVAIRRPVATSHTYVRPLSSPAASMLPSGLNATAQTPNFPVWGSVSVAARLVARFHRYVLPLSLPAASVLPSGLNATAPTLMLLGSVRVAIRRPVATFHTYALPLSSPAASVLPSGLNATAPTLMLWAKSVRVAIRRPVATFHTYALPLSSPVASMLPSGLNATALTSLIPGA